MFETGDENLLKLARTTESAFVTTTTVILLRWIHIHGISSHRGRLHKV